MTAEILITGSMQGANALNICKSVVCVCVDDIMIDHDV